MASWILPKNKRWGNFQYLKLPQRSFFGRIQDNKFFSEIFWPLVASKIWEILWPSLNTWSLHVSIFQYIFLVCPTTLIIGRTSWLSHSLMEIKRLTRFSAGEWSVKQNLVNVKNLEQMVSSSQLTTNRTSSMSSQLWVWIVCCTY